MHLLLRASLVLSLVVLGACTPSFVTPEGERAYQIAIPFGSAANDDDLEGLTRLERERVWRDRFLDRAQSICKSGHKIIKGPKFRVQRNRSGSIAIPIGSTGGFTTVNRSLADKSERITQIVCTEDGRRPAYEPRLAARIAQSESAYRSLEPVSLGDRTLMIGISTDRRVAVVMAGAGTSGASFLEIESAVAARSGCRPRFTDGLEQFTGVRSSVSSVSLDRSNELRMLLTCSNQGGVGGGSAVADYTGNSAPEQLDPNFPKGDTTYLFHSRDHGYEITYYGADGRYWFWYPGNQILLPGSWERRGAEFCTTSDRPTYNPVTRKINNGELCVPTLVASQLVLEAQPGDPLELATGKLPYRRARCDATAAFVFDRSSVACSQDRP